MNFLLEKLGIDVKRYWLLIDLFTQLSERGEMMDQLGRNGVALNTAVKLYAAISALLAAALVFADLSLYSYLATFAIFTAFILVSTLLSETGNSLVNPTEGLVLAHQPIDGATYTAAKLSHLLRIVVYLAPGLNAIPALAGLFLKGARWYYPLLHLAVAFAVGLIGALMCCALFGWLLRFVPAQRLKAAGQFAGTLPFLAMMMQAPLRNALKGVDLTRLLPSSPVTLWALAIGLAAAALAAIFLGLRSLTADYLVRVASLTRGGASAGSSGRRSLLGALVGRYFGGQAARAAFAFVSRMMLRDWQFRRQLGPALFPSAIWVIPAFLRGWPADPFASAFAPIHMLPHMLALMLLFFCTAMAFSGDYQGAWIFLLAPAHAFGGFARGMHALLWTEVIVIPNLLLLPMFCWRWGFGHGALFTLFSILAASIYLAIEIRLIHEIPFTKQPNASGSSSMLGVMLLGGLAMGAAVGVQYLLFRSQMAVLIAIPVLGTVAFLLTRISIETVAESMRFHLGLLSHETGKIYKEVDA